MKKILLVLTVLSILLLGACSSAPSDTTDLEDRITALEAENLLQENSITALNERIDNLVITTGLNGATDIYENSNDTYEDNITLSLSVYEFLVKEDEVIDVSDFPDYIFDANGDYITVNNLANLLVNKYFGITGSATTGFQFRIDFTLIDAEMTNEEFIARLSMLIIELSEYDYYILDTSQLYFYLYFNSQTVQLQSRMTLLVTDKYDLVPVIFYEELLDVNITGITYSPVVVQDYVDAFILNEDFIGYVLDYN